MTATLGQPRVAAPARDPRAPFAFYGGDPAPRRRLGFDAVLAGSALALAVIGAILVWAATRDVERAAGRDPNGYLYRHLINIGIAIGLAVLASRLNVRMLRLAGPVVYVLGLLGLLAVFAIGVTVNGAHAWIRIGAGVQIQPSEFMKLGLIIAIAVLFTQRARDRADQTPTSGDMLLVLVAVGVPLGMILLQPDLGSAMVLAASVFGMLIAAGVRARWTVGLILATVGLAILVVKLGMLADYQRARFTVFTNPNKDIQGAAYNLHQALIAISNGGLFGTGLFHGPQTNGGFVPEQQTDFVFSVAGEEFGLLGGVVIIVLFGLLCWRGLKIAREAERAGSLIAIGIVCWFAFQAFQNIGMNLGLMPITGLPLPFVSYGGSSMFAQGLALGVLEAIRRQSRAEAD